MGETIITTFEKWWEKEVNRSGDTSIYTGFKAGWSKGYRKSERDCATREELIFDAIRPLVPNLDEIIDKALMSSTTRD